MIKSSLNDKNRLAIVGNPNSGKSTLFNSMCNGNARVGNWHGVTVDKLSKSFNYKNSNFEAVDLPGIYSLSGFSPEEKVTIEHLYGKQYDAIVLVVEALNFDRGMKLFCELQALDKPIILVVNLYDELKKKKGDIDFELLKSQIKNVFKVNALNKKSVLNILDYIIEKTDLQVDKRLFLDNISKAFAPPKNLITKTDKFLLNGYLGIFAFIISSIFTFYLSFGKYGIGSTLKDAVDFVFVDFLGGKLYGFLHAYCNIFIQKFVLDGVYLGACSVLSFLPQLATLNVCLRFLEECGFIGRLSALLDGFLIKFGLNGKAIYTILSGYGCSALGIFSSKSIEDKKVKERTVMSIGFTSCSAKIPVYLYFACFCFKEYAFLVISVIYFLSIIFCLLNSLLLKTYDKNVKKLPLMLELAPLRLPKLKILLKSLLNCLKEFILRITMIIVALSGVVWLLGNVSLDFKLVSDYENTILQFLGKKLSFIFYPIGVKDWRYTVALLSGVFAKEGIVSTLTLLFPNGIFLSVRQALALTVFVFAYTPCLTALFTMRNEVGTKKTVFVAIYQFLVAIILCYITYFIVGFL